MNTEIEEGRILKNHFMNKSLPKSYEEALSLLCKERKTALFTILSKWIWETNKLNNRKILRECQLVKMSQNAGLAMFSLIFPKEYRFRGLIDHQ